MGVVNGEEMPGNARACLDRGRVPGLQNQQNYAQRFAMSIRGFGSRSAQVRYSPVMTVFPSPGQGQTSNIDLSSVQNVEVLHGLLCSVAARQRSMNATPRPNNHQPLKPVVTTAVWQLALWASYGRNGTQPGDVDYANLNHV